MKRSVRSLLLMKSISVNTNNFFQPKHPDQEEVNKMIGKRLSPILVEIEDALWEYEANTDSVPGFTDEGFRAAVKIFSCAFMERVYNLQQSEKMQTEDAMKMAYKAGCAVRKLIKTYANIDTTEFYETSEA